MANYNVGNIEIGVISTTKSALNGIDKIIAKLQEFNKIDKSIQTTFNSINKLANAFVKLGKINVDNLKNNISQISGVVKSLNDSLSSVKFDANFTENSKAINQLANALNKLQKLENLNKIDFSTLKTSLKQLANAIDPFLKKIEKSKDTLSYLSNILNNLNTRSITRATNELNRADQTASKLKSKLSNLFNIGKIYFLYNYSKRIISSVTKMIGYASDYIEILNKFQVSFGNLYEENLRLTNQLAQAFGFSTNTLMDYTSTFNNMLKGLKGLTNETSAIISQTLTKMAIDYSSLFNVSLNRAMEAFQSAISGNIRTLRSISGFDVSEITIFSIYQELGGTKSMRQLNQLEKRLLRIIAIQRQMEATGTLGDYGRTINCGFDKKLSNELFVNTSKSGVINNYVYC